jgi:nucleotide-binding universal stress UspA family protein
MRILVCIRDPEYSETALRFAGRLALDTKSDITVLTVMKKASSIYQSRIAKTQEKLLEWGLDLPHTAALKKAREILKEMGLDVEAKETGEMVLQETERGVHELTATGTHGKAVALKMREGKPEEEILAEAEEGEHDIIVVGSTEKAGVEKTVFGSVAADITAYSKAPVLAVKKEVPVKKMLLCTDGSPDAENAEIFSGFLAKKLKARLTLLAIATEDVAEEVAKEALKTGKKKIEKYFKLKPKTKLRTGNAVEEILRESKGYDLVVMGSRGLSKVKRMLVGHVSLNVEKAAETNVLVVRGCGICDDIMKRK